MWRVSFNRFFFSFSTTTTEGEHLLQVDEVNASVTVVTLSRANVRKIHLYLERAAAPCKLSID